MKTTLSHGLSPVYLLFSILILSLTSLNAGYRQVGHPDTWKLAFPTETYAIDNVEESLGTLRKNIEVEVLDVDTDNGTWTVRYNRTGDPPLLAKIKIPDLSLYFEAAFQSIEPMIAEFPLLKTLMESDLNWDARMAKLDASLQEDSSIPLWNTHALSTSVIDSPIGKAVRMEIWNREDDPDTGANPSVTKAILTKNFDKLERTFGLDGFHLATPTASQNTTEEDSTSYILPNDTVATVRSRPHKSLVLVLESFKALQSIQPEKPDPYEIADRMKFKKYTSAGHLYLSGIPLMNQGRRGYGASAMLGGIMAFYGYPVDSHRLGDLTNTESRYFENDPCGSKYADIIRASRRICAGTPFRLHQIGKKGDPSFEDIRDTIDAGNPIIWLVPGEIRMITGFYPDSREIVYRDARSDSFESMTMSWEDFDKLPQQMWVLTR